MYHRDEVILADVVADDGGGQARVERLSPSADVAADPPAFTALPPGGT
jgi:hypothetical protein